MTRQPRAALPPIVLLAGVLALVWSLSASAGTAGAQAIPDRSPDRLQILSQSSFVPSDGVYEATLAWSGATAGLNLEVGVFQLVGDESDLDERTPSGRLNLLPPVPLAELPRDAAGNLVLRIPIRSQPLPAGDPTRLYLPDPGVYPIELEVTGEGGEPVTSLFSDLIRLPAAPIGEPVPVAVVLAIGEGGVSLPAGVELLERYPDVAITVLVDPSAVIGPDVESTLVARLGAALGSRPTVAVDPVPLDVSALAEIRHLDLYELVRRSGGEQVAGVLDRAVSTAVAPIDRLPTASAAAHLAGAVDLLLAPTGSDVGVLDTPRGELPVVSADEDLMDALASPSRPAHQVLARLAIRFREGQVEPVVLTTEPGSGVTAADLAVILDGLSQPGVIRAVPLTEVAAQLSERLTPSERPGQDLRPAADLLEATIDDLSDYTDFHVTGSLSPQLLRDRVLAALAVDVRPDQRIDRLAEIRRDIGRAFDVISLPEGRTVNLAATTSPLPLTVTSEASGLRRVRITFASDKLTFPDEDGGSRVVELGAGTTSLDFVVESRSLGVSPLDVVVSTPDGSRELTRTRITIRSTAVPGLGLLLSGAALVFLVGWWVVHGRRRRRPVPGVAGADAVA